jgi:hypothetical protein
MSRCEELEKMIKEHFTPEQAIAVLAVEMAYEIFDTTVGPVAGSAKFYFIEIERKNQDRLRMMEKIGLLERVDGDMYKLTKEAEELYSKIRPIEGYFDTDEVLGEDTLFE